MLPVLFLLLAISESALINITGSVKVLAPENYAVKIRSIEENNRSWLQKYDWINIINDNPDFLLQISANIEKNHTNL